MAPTYVLSASTASLPLVTLAQPSTNVTFSSEVHITMLDLLVGGHCLLPLSIIFTFVNGFLSFLIYRNWSTIKNLRNFNKYLLGFVLTLADLALALLVGIPAGLHLTWPTYFREQATMRLYSEIVGYLIFDYIFLLRILIIVVLSVDGCLNIIAPMYYMVYVTEERVKWACITIFVLPLIVKIVPATLFLGFGNSGVICLEFNDPSVSRQDRFGKYNGHFLVPLTCGLNLRGSTEVNVNVSVYSTIELIIQLAITATSWLVITVMNVAILTLLFKRTFGDHILSLAGRSKASVRRRQIAGTKTCTRNFLLLSFTIICFTATTLPTVVVSWAEYLFRASSKLKEIPVNDRERFYISLLLFLSLLFHPWLYLLRMKSIRDALAVLKVSILHAISQSLTIENARVKVTKVRKVANKKDCYIRSEPCLIPEEEEEGSVPQELFILQKRRGA